MPRSASITALLCLAAPLAANAQMHKVAPPEKVTRAVAVYEWTGDLAKPTAARIVPVTIFINGHMEDAGDYLPEPMPFALQTGDIYSIEKAGKAQGAVDIDYARNILPPGSIADVAAIGAWYGYGKYAPLPPPAKPKALKASAHPSVIVGGLNDDDRPHFVGKQPNQPDDTPLPPNPPPAPPPTTPTDPTSATATAPPPLPMAPAPSPTATTPTDPPSVTAIRNPKASRRNKSRATPPSSPWPRPSTTIPIDPSCGAASPPAATPPPNSKPSHPTSTRL